MVHKILVVDDEKLIVKGIRFSLEQEGFEVHVAYDGEEALKLAHSINFDLIVLDVMLPKIDGLEVCQQVREFSTVPVIMLTAKGDHMDRIMGLEYGADDYITKPFNILELKARIKAILRRSIQNVPTEKVDEENILKTRELKIDFLTKTTYRNNEEINLTAKEFDLLYLFIKNTGKIYSREMLLEEVWGNSVGDVRTVDVHVRRLREKIELNPSDPKYIHTKWGVGYYFK